MSLKKPQGTPSILSKTLLEAEKLRNRRMMYNLSTDDITASAFVVDKKGIPYEVSVDRETGQASGWFCECNPGSFCVHLSCLCLQLVESGWLSRGFPVSRLKNHLEEKHESVSVSSQCDLFSNHEDQLSLFSFQEEETLKEEWKPCLLISRLSATDPRLQMEALMKESSSGYLRSMTEQDFISEGIDENDEWFRKAPHRAVEFIQAVRDGFVKPELALNGKRPGIETAGCLMIRFSPFERADGLFFTPVFEFTDKEHLLWRTEQIIIEENLVYGLHGRKLIHIILNDTEIALLTSINDRLSPASRDDLDQWYKKEDHCKNLILEKRDEKIIVLHPEPVCRILLRTEYDGLTLLDFQFEYQQVMFFYGDKQMYFDLRKGAIISRIMRDSVKEQEREEHALVILGDKVLFRQGHYGSDLSGFQGNCKVDLTPGNLLVSLGDRLFAAGFKLSLEGRDVKQKGELKFNMNSRQDWFDINSEIVDEEGHSAPPQMSESDLSSGIIARGNDFVRLSTADIEKLNMLVKQGMNPDGVLETHSLNLGLINSLYQDALQKDEEGLQQNLELARNLEGFSEDKCLEAPDGFKAVLRPYQKWGYSWMLHLLEHGVNGCLADDMGLGKTIQALAVIKELINRGASGPYLVVAPVVTLFNWMNEAARFTPDLSCYLQSGQNRLKEVSQLNQFDIVLVSYHTLRNDLALFTQKEFPAVILDEAHYIKNASSQVFKAVRSLKSRRRLSLTGTPIENSTMELWSQMDFLNPGLLGTMTAFWQQFARPIEKDGDKEQREMLQKRIAPFILRRHKEDVLDELPEREDIIHYCDMGQQQRSLYNEHRDYIRQRIKGLSRDNSLESSGFEIFQYLLKLRQIAIHPGLADSSWDDINSCKFDALKLMLNDIMQEDHKVLIFSQFTATLRHMETLCQQNDWQYSLLTGQTRDRQKQVDRFQNDKDVKVFLLSLKAGGVGINLTSADYVILFDPWWNPAVERQAIDRAYRMGQTRKVMAYRFITRDSIEEKILNMQKVKQSLAQDIIRTDNDFFAALNEDKLLNLL